MVQSERECVFCKIVRGEVKSSRVGESNSFIAILDIKPKTDGHTLIIPKKHYVTLLDMPNKLGEEMLEFCKSIAGKMLDSKKGDGFNLIMNNLEPAGQIVKHAHIHIIPRREDDSFRSPV
jgi:histidine triad (HIT) family protein